MAALELSVSDVQALLRQCDRHVESGGFHPPVVYQLPVAVALVLLEAPAVVFLELACC